MSEFNQQKYIAEYNRKNYRVVKIRLHREYDKDLIERLEKEKSMQGYIKNLIREDLKREEK